MYFSNLEKFVVVAVLSFIVGTVFGQTNSRSTSVIASPAPNYENIFNRESREKCECGKTLHNGI
jgi:hypothetical protein